LIPEQIEMLLYSRVLPRLAAMPERIGVLERSVIPTKEAALAGENRLDVR
jgi:hypothetical protein